MEDLKEIRMGFIATIAFLMLVLVGCAVDHPMVRMEKDVTLSDYRTFEVGATKNGTGITLPEGILEEITKKLRVKLAEKGLTLNENKGDVKGVVVLQSTLISYELIKPVVSLVIPGSKDECIVQVELLDKKTNQSLGDFVAKGTSMGGGLMQLALDPENRIIDTAAESIAEEIARQVGKR